MEHLFVALMERIAGQMPELSVVDEDYGQLETVEESYPLTFPCVLISTPSVVWSSMAGRVQSGRVTVEVTLALDCYEDTHYASGTHQRMAERMVMVDRLHGAVHHFAGEGFSKLVRTESVFQSLRGGIKAYRMSYTSQVYDDGLTPDRSLQTVKAAPSLSVAFEPLGRV